MGAVMQTIAFAVQASAPPFSAYAAVYFLTGFGVSLEVSCIICLEYLERSH